MWLRRRLRQRLQLVTPDFLNQEYLVINKGGSIHPESNRPFYLVTSLDHLWRHRQAAGGRRQAASRRPSPPAFQKRSARCGLIRPAKLSIDADSWLTLTRPENPSRFFQIKGLQAVEGLINLESLDL